MEQLLALPRQRRLEGGTWSNYSRYRDDDILTVSSIDRGLFVLETDVDD